MSFLMIVSLAYVTIETVDPEPALATGEFDCVDSKGEHMYIKVRGLVTP